MAQQDEGRIHQGGALACVVDHPAQIGLQAARTQQVAAWAFGLAVALVVISPHRKTPLVQVRRHLAIAPGVLTQAVHQDHRAQELAGRQGPIVNRELTRLALQA